MIRAAWSGPHGHFVAQCPGTINTFWKTGRAVHKMGWHIEYIDLDRNEAHEFLCDANPRDERGLRHQVMLVAFNEKLDKWPLGSTSRQHLMRFARAVFPHLRPTTTEKQDG